MKKIALVAVAASMAASSFVAPALADGSDFDVVIDATIVSLDMGMFTLSNGAMLHLSEAASSLPPEAAVGDTVRINIDGADNRIRSVRIIGMM